MIVQHWQPNHIGGRLMAYCRWSSMDFQCDLYVYHSSDGTWPIHVAAGRLELGREPDPYSDENIKLMQTDISRWFSIYNKWYAELKTRSTKPIGLSLDGESFYPNSAKECADICEKLIALGYLAPPDLIEDLLSEGAVS